MGIRIELSPADVDCIRCHSLPSTLRRKLRYSYLTSRLPKKRLVESSTTIDCNEGDARALLSIARMYCPEAVEKIESGLRLSGVTIF